MKSIPLIGALLGVFLGKAADAAETITYTYDAKGRLVTVVRTGTVNNGVTATYNHDKANNRTSVVKTKP
jgi:YD repeat-containing protein